jgi:hypothetical protein
MLKSIFKRIRSIWYVLILVIIAVIGVGFLIADTINIVSATAREGYVANVEYVHSRGPDYYKYEVIEADDRSTIYTINDEWQSAQRFNVGNIVTFYAAEGSDYAKFSKGLSTVSVVMLLATAAPGAVWLWRLFGQRKLKTGVASRR